MGKKKPRKPGTAAPTPPIPIVHPPSIWKKHAWVAAALFVITLLAYSNSFHSRFVIDNKFLILDDPRVHDATSANVDLIFHHTYWWPTSELGLYRPATTLSFLFNYATLGNADHPAGYHWINFLLHFLNVVLLYFLGLRMIRKFWPAVFIAALWALHPVLTESVTNIAGRADLLAAMAVLSGLLIYLRSAESTGWRRYAWLAGLISVTTIGVFSKENAVAILGVVVLYEFTFWKERNKDTEYLRGAVLGCAAISLPILVMLYQRAQVLAASPLPGISFVDNPLRGANFFSARLTAIAVMAKYLWLLIWPAKLSTDYSYSQIPIASGTVNEWIAWIAVLVVAAAIARQFAKNRACFFFGAFAFVTFLPIANLLFVTGTIMAERLFYLPSIGLAACAVIALYAFGERVKVPMLAPVAICLLALCFGVRTWARNIDWHDEHSIAEASVLSAPNSFKAHFNLAVQISNSDPTGSNISDAIAEIEKSMAILNSLPDSQNTATVYAEAGREYAERGDRFIQHGADGRQTAPPQSVLAYQRSLEVLLRGVAIDRASGIEYRQRLRAEGRPADVPVGIPNLYEQLSNTYWRLEDFPKAYDAAVRARELEPAKVENYIVIGQALVAQGRRAEAAQAFTEGMLVSGNQNLVAALSQLYRGGLDPAGCAIKQTPQGVQLDPSCAPVHDNLCRASAELSQLYKKGQREDVGAAIKSQAIQQFGCPVDQLQ
jgi:protein O-mannosyl-transferase